MKIGNNVGITNSCFVSTKGITIEDNVLIGGNCKFYDTDFHSIKYKERVLLSDINKKSASIHIGEGAWIGGHCIILKGVTIGKRSVIGAGSVVTCDIPDCELWAGNPARFIRKL